MKILEMLVNFLIKRVLKRHSAKENQTIIRSSGELKIKITAEKEQEIIILNFENKIFEVENIKIERDKELKKLITLYFIKSLL